MKLPWKFREDKIFHFCRTLNFASGKKTCLTDPARRRMRERDDNVSCSFACKRKQKINRRARGGNFTGEAAIALQFVLEFYI